MKKLIITTTTYIVPCIIIFLAILAIFVYPYRFPLQESNANCVLGDPPPANTLILKLPSVENFGPSRTKTSEFVLVRSNVPASDILGFFKPPDPFLEPNADDAHTVQVDHNPDIFGFDENPQKPGFDEFYPYGGAGGKVYSEGDEATYTGKPFSLIDLGLVFYRSKDPTTIRQIPTADPTVFHHVYSVDIYQDVAIANQPGSVDQFKELLKCRGKAGTEGAFKSPLKVVIPDQNSSPNNEQLQLEWFVFKSEGSWTVHCKPAVYLYPPHQMQVNVKVFPAGTLVYTDPQYDSKTGWTVEAYPDGTLIQANQRISESANQYPYLYFESKVKDEVIRKPTKGWVIESESRVKSQESRNWFIPLEKKFNEILPSLGLNVEQTKDFIDYWKKALPYSPYYFVGIIDQANVDQIERLEITPKPDSINRVRIYFERLEQSKTVEAPNIVNQTGGLPSNQLFRVVEWGGMVKNDLNHPFTCSQ